MKINRVLSGQDPIDFNDKHAGFRVGTRIRKIRNDRGLSQAELGELMGLSADRIQKYENGIRKPKSDLIKKFAEVLNVSTLALVDPITTTQLGAIYAMFELEQHFNMKIQKIDDDFSPRFSLSVGIEDELYGYMEEWYDFHEQIQDELGKASSEKEREEIIKTYTNWEWSFPQAIVDKTEKERKKAVIKKKIEELQNAYNKLDGNDD